METMTARLVDVVPNHLGDEFVADAAIGTTVLSLGDTTDFDEDGGQVMVSGDVYDYVSCDHDAATVTLATGLTVAAVEGDPAWTFSEALGQLDVEYVANVLLEDQSTDDEPIEVGVPIELVRSLVQGVRGMPAETVDLARDGEDDWYVVRVNGIEAADIVADQAAIDAAAAIEAAEGALTEAQLAQAIADGHVDVYYATSAPWSNGSTAHDADTGDVWVDTDAPVDTAYRWLNRTWTLIGDASVVQALLAAQSAQVTADGKIRLFVKNYFPVQDGADGHLGYGDQLHRTDQDNKKYYWDGDSWEPLVLGDAGIAATLTGKIVRTGSGGDRMQMRDDGAGGIIEGFVGGVLKGALDVTGSGVRLTGPGGGSAYILIDTLGETLISGSDLRTIGPIYAGDDLIVDGNTHLSGDVDVTGGNFDVYDGGILRFRVGMNSTATGELHGDTVFVDNAPTTGSAANVFIGASGQLWKSTSSKRYKKNVKAAKFDVRTLLALIPRTFQSRSKADDPDRLRVGFVAEEAHELGLTEWVEYDEQGRPDGFAYPAWVAALQHICREQQTQIDALTKRLEALEAQQ